MSTTLYRKNEDGSIEEISVPGEHVASCIESGYGPSKEEIELKLKAEADERERLRVEQEEVERQAYMKKLAAEHEAEAVEEQRIKDEEEKVRLEEEEKLKAEQAALEAKEDAPEAPTIEEVDAIESDELSNQEIRDAAEHAGIDGFATKRINTLMEELGYANEAGTN